MKEYESINEKIIINGENITIVSKKKNITKGDFSFSDITELVWQEPKNMPGTLNIRTAPKGKLHILNFWHESHEMFLELRDLISQKSNVDFQIQTFGGLISRVFTQGFKALFWFGLAAALLLSALHSMFGIFG